MKYYIWQTAKGKSIEELIENQKKIIEKLDLNEKDV